MTLERFNEIVEQVTNSVKDIKLDYVRDYLIHKHVKQIIISSKLVEKDTSKYVICDLDWPWNEKYKYVNCEQLPSSYNHELDVEREIEVFTIDELKGGINRYDNFIKWNRIIGYLD